MTMRRVLRMVAIAACVLAGAGVPAGRAAVFHRPMNLGEPGPDRDAILARIHGRVTRSMYMQCVRYVLYEQAGEVSVPFYGCVDHSWYALCFWAHVNERHAHCMGRFIVLNPNYPALAEYPVVVCTQISYWSYNAFGQPRRISSTSHRRFQLYCTAGPDPAFSA